MSPTHEHLHTLLAFPEQLPSRMADQYQKINPYKHAVTGKKKNMKLHVLKKTESTSLPPFESSGRLNLYYFYTTCPNWQFSWRRVAKPNHICPDICMLSKGPWLLMRYVLSLNCQKWHADLRLLLLSPVSLIYLIHPKSKSFVVIKMVTHTPKFIV